MRHALGFAPDGGGCLQRAHRPEIRFGETARYRFFGRDGNAESLASRDTPAIQNDNGYRVIRVSVRAVVCSGQSPPDDHPHVALKIGKGDQVLCPYCGTRFEYQPAIGPR